MRTTRSALLRCADPGHAEAADSAQIRSPGQLVEGNGYPPVGRLLNGQLACPRQTFWVNACPVRITQALRSCLSPRIGRRRAFNLP